MTLRFSASPPRINVSAKRQLFSVAYRTTTETKKHRAIADLPSHKSQTNSKSERELRVLLIN